MVEVVDLLEHARERRLDLDQALVLARARLGDLEDLRLGLVEHLPDFLAGRAERGLGDLGGDQRELALHRALAHQLGVAPHVERAGGVVRQRRQVGRAAGLVLVLAALDRLEHRDHVGRAGLLDQARDVAPDAAVVVAVEVLAGDQVGDLVERLVVEQQRAEQRLLRLHRVRRQPEGYELRISALLARIGVRALLRQGHFFCLPPRPPS